MTAWVLKNVLFPFSELPEMTGAIGFGIQYLAVFRAVYTIIVLCNFYHYGANSRRYPRSAGPFPNTGTAGVGAGYAYYIAFLQELATNLVIAGGRARYSPHTVLRDCTVQLSFFGLLARVDWDQCNCEAYQY